MGLLNFTLLEPKKHPIVSKKYVVPTPALEELLKVVLCWVENFYTGSVVYGYQRLGKSSAIKYIVEEIKNVFGPNVLVGIAPMLTNARLSEAAFWGQILKGLGHSLWSRGSAQAKRDRLFKYLKSFSENHDGEGRVVLFVDDAQKLQECHYDWLSEIHNDLDLTQIHLATFLVGQPELLGTKTTLENNHKYEIIARFMTDEYQFHGIQDENQAAVILNVYDENTEYPIGSGCSYTKYFFPQAFELGWRLEHEVEKIWSVILEVKSSHHISEELLIMETHMEYFARIVEALLKAHKTSDPGFNGFTSDQIRTAICRSGYVGASKYLKYKEVLPRPMAE